MPVCPECQYEYRSGVKTCPECKVDLVEGLKDPVTSVTAFPAYGTVAPAAGSSTASSSTSQRRADAESTYRSWNPTPWPWTSMTRRIWTSCDTASAQIRGWSPPSCCRPC